MNTDTTNRRNFLKFLAASPLMTSFAWKECLAIDDFSALEKYVDDLINSPNEAINVFDFERVAKSKLPPAHYGHLTTGVDDNLTLRENREAFTRIYLRPRRLVDVSTIDMKTRLFGESWSSPIVLAPAGGQMAFHPDGEIASAKAARNRQHLQILSTGTSYSVEDVAAARGAPIWYQLYAVSPWEKNKTMLKRAEAAGCPVVVVTVDVPILPNREMVARFKRKDSGECSVCHDKPITQRAPMYKDLKMTGLESILGPRLNWDFIEYLKEQTTMKVMLKGIVTAEDALLSIKHGVDGIIVSNHGGRAEESIRATINSLPEVVAAVEGKIPVMVDSGFRRGTDIFKALALGASAVCIGRPYLWGLASFGQAGVEMVLKILQTELETTMKFAGTTSLKNIKRSHVGLTG